MGAHPPGRAPRERAGGNSGCRLADSESTGGGTTTVGRSMGARQNESYVIRSHNDHGSVSRMIRFRFVGKWLQLVLLPTRGNPPQATR